jgi:hypothetical protein
MVHAVAEALDTVTRDADADVASADDRDRRDRRADEAVPGHAGTGSRWVPRRVPIELRAGKAATRSREPCGGRPHGLVDVRLDRLAGQLADRVPKLGGHIATLDLQPDLGICIAKTGGAAHWSVWGRPLQLESCVTDVVEATT